MKFKKKQLKSTPCRKGADLAESLDWDFAKIYDQCERGDWLIWLLRNSIGLTKEQSSQIAIECAQGVLNLFEEKHPNDNRPRLAIEAASQWLLEPTEKNRNAAYAAAVAANAAYAAAVAANAATYAATYAAAAATTNVAYAATYADAADAYAAAAAANAADAAAYAATYATNAAAFAAYAAYAATYTDAADAYAAAAAATEITKQQADMIRKLIPNPFV